MGQLGINVVQLIVQLLAFLILILLLRRFAYGPILRALDARSQRVAASMEQADRIERQLAETEARNQAILDEARREAQGIVTRAREIGDQQIAQAREVARSEADKQLQLSLAPTARRGAAGRDGVAPGVRRPGHPRRLPRRAPELDPQKHIQLIDPTLREADGGQAAADK
jgi:F-type H+-transporting ATPase subunit b